MDLLTSTPSMSSAEQSDTAFSPTLPSSQLIPVLCMVVTYSTYVGTLSVTSGELIGTTEYRPWP